jgi:hypothetical protein
MLEHEQTKQSDRSRTRDECDVTRTHFGDFAHGMDGGGQRFHQGALLLGNRVVEAEQLVGANTGVAGEGPADAVAHAATFGAEHEVAAQAPPAATTTHCGGAEHGVPPGAIDRSADRRAFLDHPTDEFVAQDDGREVAKRVMQDVQIGAADTAGGDLQFHLMIGRSRLRYIP